jgi:hypothetical protein
LRKLPYCLISAELSTYAELRKSHLYSPFSLANASNARQNFSRRELGIAQQKTIDQPVIAIAQCYQHEETPGTRSRVVMDKQRLGDVRGDGEAVAVPSLASRMKNRPMNFHEFSILWMIDSDYFSDNMMKVSGKSSC